MTPAQSGEPSNHTDAEDIGLAHVDDLVSQLAEQSVDEWDAIRTARRLILDYEPRENVPADECYESTARFAALWAQQEEIAFARYRALRNEAAARTDQGNVNTRARPADTQYGSDGNQYNPYAPHTSEEYVSQEIEAGRMDPEMMNVPHPRLNPVQSPLPGNGTAPRSAQVLADRHVPWVSSDHRLIYGRDMRSRRRQFGRSGPRDLSWSQSSYADSMITDSPGEEDHADSYPALLPQPDIEEPQIASNSPPNSAPGPDIRNLDNPYDFPEPLNPRLGRRRPNVTPIVEAPRHLPSALSGRQRRRLAKPSLVVKLKTPGLRSRLAPLSPRRGRPGASSSGDSSSSSSGDSSSAARITPDPRHINLRSQAPAGSGPSTTRPRTRRAEVIQNSQRKRRRDDASLQGISIETATPTAGLSQGHHPGASSGASEHQRLPTIHIEAPAITPASATTSARTAEDIAALKIIRQSLARQLDRQAHYIPSPPRPSCYLPPLRYLRTHRVFFTSELLPRHFGPQKRRDILNILRMKASYVPACINMAPGVPRMQYHIFVEKSLNPMAPYHAPFGSRRRGWPKDSLPLEVFHNIAAHLSREDLLQMRMVNTEFERKISNIVFHAVVVPFRPEIYGMMIHDGPTPDTKIDRKGKAKAKDLYRPVEQEKTLHDGMKVFEAWGPHIKKFAMAFDVEENQLTRPPVKGKFEFFSEFWGKYRWPHPYYSRFDFCAGLEKKADEFRCMSAALSNLQGVRELGVSIDSGLGYLCGPDISDRAQLFQEKPKIFGVSDTQRNLKFLERQCQWNEILRSLGPAAATNYVIQGDNILANQTLLSPNEWGCYEVHFYIPSDPHSESWRVGLPRTRGSRVEFVDATGEKPEDRNLIFQGVNLANNPQLGGGTDVSAIEDVNTLDHASFQGREKSPFHTAALVPNNLTPAQKEWLLETEWAQRAFLSSYCMALSDNSHTFQHVHSFTVARLSSRYLSALQREDFWGALPNLNALTINVSPDWRSIIKAESGVVEAPDIRPSGAATQFHKLLVTCIAVIPRIKKLSLGYYGGGEHQVGIFGRNRHILPAPLTDFSDHLAATSINADILVLPFVEHLTLTNCWITPPSLKTFVAQMRTAKLRTLTLDSVSLTAHSGVANNVEPDPVENGVLRVPDGPPRRFGDPALGDLFDQRGSAPDPRSDGFGWMVESCRIGSWGNVIDAITPGPTIQLLRYAYQHLHDVPDFRDPGPLERINFVSCGYVKLVNMKDFNQSFLGEIISNPPHCLRKRAVDLMSIVMHRNDDPLLGQIIPTLQSYEQEVFQTAFPMEMNLKTESKLDNQEDGQPIAGSGRFSGSVKKLVMIPIKN